MIKYGAKVRVVCNQCVEAACECPVCGNEVPVIGSDHISPWYYLDVSEAGCHRRMACWFPAYMLEPAKGDKPND